MSYLIAVTGKGGVGKTTFSALLVRGLLSAGHEPVLAIDADPNSCLDAALGVKAEQTVGRAREEVRAEADEAAKNGVSKQELLNLKISQSLVESKGFDLIAMGRPEGAGCYCYANNVLKSVISQISDEYPYVVLDNEAGLENLSRRIVQHVNTLALVSDASNAGMQTLLRLYELSKEMEISFDKLVIVINSVRGGKLPARAQEIKEKTGASLIVGLPYDEQIAEFAENGDSLLSIPDDNPVAGVISEMIREIV